MSKKLQIPRDRNIISIPIEEAMPDNYLPYAVEVAKDRALPDVRDGLKPVHRRIIYGAYKLSAFPDKPYYKSARIVGDILGKYHPHGDTSVYDAMVILAQDFTTRKPLIDGHGNWGSQDGDSAAAMRYTEARLTPIAMEMIRDIDKGVVNMVDNYSASEKEPEVLPARYPNILVNGAFGIAVGLATNIPPHNLGEVIDATLAYIDNNNIDVKGLMEYIKGPDLPTGGILIGKNSLLSAYETGIGKVTLRAKAAIERLENGRLGIVITEFPYRRNKAKLLQVISEMTADKKHSKALESISDIRDESDRTGVRAVIEFKKSADEETASKVLKYLYKKTDLQCNLSFNMVALVNGKPETMGLKTIIYHYVNHQKDVITKRTKRELEIAEKRFHIVQGFIKAIDIMDEVIKTIRGSKSKKDAKDNLINKFSFTEIQAEAILELMLYRLTGLEIKTFEKEYKELEREIKRLNKILKSEKELLKVIKNELLEIKNKYADDRKTTIVEDDEEAKIDVEELIVEEDVIITMSNEGFIKRVPLKSYNRSNINVEDIEYREGDFNRFLISSNTKDTLTLFTDKGNMYQIKVIAIPELRWKEKGERIDGLIKGLNLEEAIVNAYSIDNFAAQKDFMFITSKGAIKKTNLDKYNTSYTKLMALKLKDDEKLIKVELMPRDREEKFIKIKTGEGLEFTMEEPSLQAVDRNILSVQLFNLSDKDFIQSIDFVEEGNYKIFHLGIMKNGKVKEVSERVKSCDFIVNTDSSSKLLIFLKDGNVILIHSYMLQNLKDKGINILDLLGNNDNKNKVLNVLSFKGGEELGIYFFTKNGLVKKTMLSEFYGDYFVTTGYKFKSDKDELIAVDFSEEEKKEDIIIITKRAMCIRFDKNTVNPMGRIASGVTGISLKEDDKAAFAFIIKEKHKKVLIKSMKKNEETVSLENIKVQNRAGRGNNIMLVVMDDCLKNVEIIN
ncbi:DNA gyrase subunit A [Clostridium liquoris]|jgi:topoisomerase-4 subunit A|uniref:DNA topoisomerase (ATP-hydrolyzing) n=1 Tax=Clostridium liquoris TaxID=1289519 RepID=A0A2T0B636_9CLOT|nr:DNA topoisomerase IV subunit A [Clostridium liquoris]PRR79350.1 DNA gyrase subunit A [Clostridium liquoris]